MSYNKAEIDAAYRRVSPDLIEAYIHKFNGDHQSLLEIFAAYVRLENLRTRHQMYRFFLDGGKIDKTRVAQELEAMEPLMDNLVMYLDGTLA